MIWLCPESPCLGPGVVVVRDEDEPNVSDETSCGGWVVVVDDVLVDGRWTKRCGLGIRRLALRWRGRLVLGWVPGRSERGKAMGMSKRD